MTINDRKGRDGRVGSGGSIQRWERTGKEVEKEGGKG